MKRSDIYDSVAAAVGEALGSEPDEVVATATLLGDLGAESIDLLDILFRIERSLHVKISAGELADYVTGGIADDDFGGADEVVSPVGLAQLQLVMPQIDASEWSGKLKAHAVMGLFTVDNLVTLVEGRVELAQLVA